MSTISHIKNGSTIYDVKDSRLGEMELFTAANAGKFLIIGEDGAITLSDFNGSVNYEELSNLPKINGTDLIGNLNVPLFANEAVLHATTAAFTTDEKVKLAGIAAHANNYILPVANAIQLGGVKIDNDTIVIDNVTHQISADFSPINDQITIINNNISSLSLLVNDLVVTDKVTYVANRHAPDGAYGVIWYDTGHNPTLIKIWNGSAWTTLNTADE